MKNDGETAMGSFVARPQEDGDARSLILLPNEAAHVQVLAGNEGTTVRWMQNCCDDEGPGDTWEVTVAPSRHHVDVLVEYGDAHDCPALGLLDSVRAILKHQTGVSVDVALRSKAT